MSIAPHAEPFHHEGGSVGVLFCHGFTGSPAAARLGGRRRCGRAHGRPPRLPGHGTRWQELAVTRWQDWYACVDAEYARLAERCEQVFVAGLSMGGSLALRLAEQHSDVAGLILVNPALGSTNPMARLAPALKLLVPTTPAIANDTVLPGVDEGAYPETPVAAVGELWKLWADVKATLDLVTCPLLVYRSRIDHVVPASSVDTIRRLVSSTDYSEVTLLDSYHVATLDSDAHKIVAGTLEFLARVSGQAPVDA